MASVTTPQNPPEAAAAAATAATADKDHDCHEDKYKKTQLPQFGVGVAAGYVGSLVGMGGAFIAIPFMTGYLKVPRHETHGTSGAAVFFTSLGGGMAYYYASQDDEEEEEKEGEKGEKNVDAVQKVQDVAVPTSRPARRFVDMHAAMCIALLSAPFAVIGARYSKRIPANALQGAMGALLFSLGPSSMYQSSLSPAAETQQSITKSLPSPSTSKDALDSYLKNAVYFVIGCGSGLMTGIFGVGGGAIIIPCLCLFTDMDHKTAVGTSLASMFPAAAFGAWAHYRQKTMIVTLAIPLGLGSFIGSTVGGLTGKKIDDIRLKQLFAAMTMFLGGKQLIGAFR